MALGYPHPDYLMGQITSRQLAEWAAYYEIEPFGSPADDYRNGLAAMMLANVYRKKNSQKVEMRDLYPWMERGVQEKTPDDLYKQFRSWALVNKGLKQ